MAYNVTGSAGNDTLNQSSDTGPGTIVGLAGNDCIFTGSGVATVDGGSGEDTVVLQAGNTGTVTGGTENDSFFAATNIGSMVLQGNQGADTIDTSASTFAQIIQGGNDSADGADSIRDGDGADLVFGNGGADTLSTANGADTLIGGFDNDSFFSSDTSASHLAFGNEGNDTFNIYGGSDTIFLGRAMIPSCRIPGAVNFSETRATTPSAGEPRPET